MKSFIDLYLYYNDLHKARYIELIEEYSIEGEDPYRLSLAYLIALTTDTYNNRHRLYNKEERCIIPEGLNAAFQTGTTEKITLLAFNLFTSSTAFCSDEMRERCTPDFIFDSPLAPYFVEALKIRYPYSFIDFLG